MSFSIRSMYSNLFPEIPIIFVALGRYIVALSYEQLLYAEIFNCKAD